MRRVHALSFLLVAVGLLLWVAPVQPPVGSATWRQAQQFWDFYRPDFVALADALDLDQLPAQAIALWDDHEHQIYVAGAQVSAGLIVGGVCEAGAVVLTAGTATPLCFSAGLAVAGWVRGGSIEAVIWAVLGAGYGWWLRRGPAGVPARAGPRRRRLRTRYPARSRKNVEPPCTDFGIM